MLLGQVTFLAGSGHPPGTVSTVTRIYELVPYMLQEINALGHGRVSISLARYPDSVLLSMNEIEPRLLYTAVTSEYGF